MSVAINDAQKKKSQPPNPKHGYSDSLRHTLQFYQPTVGLPIEFHIAPLPKLAGCFKLTHYRAVGPPSVAEGDLQ